MAIKAVNTITLVKVLDGKPGRVYMLEASSSVLKIEKDNAITPYFIDFSAFYRDGTSATRTEYKCRFVIEETEDGNTWTTIYTSATNENSVRHFLYSILVDSAGNAVADSAGDVIVGNPRINVQQVRCKMYAAGGTTNLLDVQTITIVRDVESLTHEEVFDLVTNSGKIKGIYKEGNEIYINATYIKSGTFVAGGLNNVYGRYEVRDAADKVIGRWDKDGIYVDGGEIKSTSINSELSILGGRINVYKNGIEAGYIGSNHVRDYPELVGLSFNLEPTGSYMIWSKRDKEADDYTSVLYYIRGGTQGEEKDIIKFGCDVSMLGHEIKNAYIRGLNAVEYFKIPNNVQCDIYSDIDFHYYKLKNVKIENLNAINGVATCTGEFIVQGAFNKYNITVNNGLITSVTVVT